MDIRLLFRKRSPLSEEGLSWIRGCEEHPFTARRNHSSTASASAILIRALLACVDGSVRTVALKGSDLIIQIAARSAPGRLSYCALTGGRRYAIPHGAVNKITYHAGVAAVVSALRAGREAADFLASYAALLGAWAIYGLSESIKPQLLRAGDELYYWMRYEGSEPGDHTDVAEQITLVEADQKMLAAQLQGEAVMDIRPLTNLEMLQRQFEFTDAPTPAAAVLPDLPSEKPSTFVGWQAEALVQALSGGEKVLLAGPTGTGKTFAVHQALQCSLREVALVTIEGKEGLSDLDFLGALLPQTDGSRVWVDGPLLRAMRLTGRGKVLLFIDEINRIPRHHLNLLIGLLNPKSGAICRQLGLPIEDESDYYVLEVPMTSEIIWCEAESLRVVCAGNFGRAYAVYDLDPALRRRFDTVIEFSYLPYDEEIALLQNRTGAPVVIAQALVKLAGETRRLMGNGELPGCIDTASLINWGTKCVRVEASTTQEVMKCAALTWGDLVCGRDYTGQVNAGNLKALQDYLEALAVLPDHRR